MQKLTENSGTYLLRYYLASPVTISTIKRFAQVTLQPGYYYYSGSAQNGLRNRVCRHLRKEKKVHWHIDHITTNPLFTLIDAYIFPEAGPEFECQVVSTLHNQFNMEFPLDNFGNSDCNVCRSHLLHSPVEIDYNHLFSLYHSTVRLIPSDKETFCS